ncbi:hypothetical protein OOK48_35125 [Streptomyces viridodiastaticus]|uniref:hypothetical protein n=1 Tax=Streptomyces albogriseolus TaxID=1887 RepID=UPI0022541563|nr:hypothetical protein [Streptomyces viridodiastaticus]MCX4571555.1 hypothetical protein [Streptomyces viridodiastaticus]
MPEIVWYFVIPVLWVVGAFGAWVAVRGERAHPSSYPHRPESYIDQWRAMSARAQEAHDEAVLDAAEAAQTGAVRSPGERLPQGPGAEVMGRLYRLPVD